MIKVSPGEITFRVVFQSTRAPYCIVTSVWLTQVLYRLPEGIILLRTVMHLHYSAVTFGCYAVGSKHACATTELFHPIESLFNKVAPEIWLGYGLVLAIALVL